MGKMDHFCVWLNNGVSFYNYKYFILTIIYLFVSCLMAICILIYRLFITNYVKMEYGIFNVLCLLLTVIICIFFLAFSAMHSFQHLWQMSKNLTSIEYQKFMQLSAMARHFQIDFPNTHEYDHGLFSNCRYMLGYDFWFWLLPTAPSMSEDGYKFEVNTQNKAKIENVGKMIQTKREQLWKKSKFVKS